MLTIKAGWEEIIEMENEVRIEVTELYDVRFPVAG